MLEASSIAITIWCCLLTASVAEIELPDFLAYENRFGYFLPSKEPWRPSEATLFTALMRDRPLRVETRLTKNFINLLSCSLIYKCQPDDENVNEISVIGDQSANRIRQVFCQESTPFVVNMIPNRKCWFNMTLVRASRVKFHQSFNHWLDLRVRLEFEIGGRIESASLFAFNFDSLANINDSPSIISGVEATRYILAEKGLQFLISDTDSDSNKKGMTQLMLLDKKFTTLFRGAPLLIQAMTSVSVMIRVNKRCTEPLGSNSPDLLITTGDPRTAISDTLANETEYVLDLYSGLLNYNAFALLTRRQVLKARASKLSLLLSICIFVTFNYPIWDYQLTLTIVNNWKTSFTLPSTSVRNRIDNYTSTPENVSNLSTNQTSSQANVSDLSTNHTSASVNVTSLTNYNTLMSSTVSNLPNYYTSTSAPSTSIWCSLPRDENNRKKDSQSIILAEGLKDVFLFNPILCNRGHTSFTRVFVSGVECANYITTSKEKWQSCDKLDLYISRSGSAFWIKGTVTVKHSGKYKFLRDDLSFTFSVTVVSFPLFYKNTTRNIGSMPLSTYAQLYNQVLFNCTAYHEGMQHVTLEPRFHTIWPSKMKLNKISLSRIDFARKVLKTSPNAIKIAYDRTKRFARLTVEMPRVTEYWKMWQLEFTCQASIPADDAALMGVSHYSVSTSTQVNILVIH